MYESLARDAADRYGIPFDLFSRQIKQESGWNPDAVSPAGAIGLGQLMPGTAADLGVDPRDPAQNLDGAARYLRQQYDKFGDWRLALAAFNAGPGNVQKYGGIPPFAETQNYVAAILGEGGGEYAPPQNALAGAAQSEPGVDVNALLALLDEQEQPEFDLWQGHDLGMFLNRRA